MEVCTGKKRNESQQTQDETHVYERKTGDKVNMQEVEVVKVDEFRDL